MFRFQTWLVALVLLLLCFLSYGNIFQNGFLIDDNILFYDSASNLQDVSNLTLLKEGHNFTYRPLGLMVLKFEFLWFKHNPAPYHVINFFVFYLVGLLMYLIVRDISKDRLLAFLASALYVVHPIQNFFLNYKTAVNLSLYVLFMALATFLFIRYFQRRNIFLYLLSLLAYLAAMLCHEISFILPVFLFLILHFFYDFKLREKFLLCLWYVVPFAIFLFLRTQSVKSNRIDSLFTLGLPINQYLNTVVDLWGWYFSKLLWPSQVLFMWEEKLYSPEFNFWYCAILVGVLGILVLAFIKGRKKISAFAASIFLISLLPSVLACFTYTRLLRTALIEPHWFGFGIIGFFVLIAGGVLKLQKNFPKVVWVALTVILIVGLAFWTNVTNRVWKDDKTFADYWIPISSINATPWEVLARRYITENDKGSALGQYQDCTEPANLALMYHIRRDAKKALKYYQLSLDMDSECSAAYYGLGILFIDDFAYDRAEQYFKKGSEKLPEYEAAYRLLGQMFVDQGQIDYGRRIRDIVNRANKERKDKGLPGRLTGGWVF